MEGISNKVNITSGTTNKVSTTISNAKVNTKPPIPQVISENVVLETSSKTKAKLMPAVLDNVKLSVSTKIPLASLKESSGKILKSGAVGVPIDMIFNIFSYNSGKIDSQAYMAKSVNGFASWSVFEAGLITSTAVAAKIIGKKLSPFSQTAIGVGAGMIAHSLYQKTIGHKAEEKLAQIIPQKISDPIANTINKFIGKPIDKYMLTPIKNNPVASSIVGGAILTGLTIKYPAAFGKNFLLPMVTASAIGIAGNIGIELAIPTNKQAKPTIADLKKAMEIQNKYDNDSESVSNEEALFAYKVLKDIESLSPKDQEKLIKEFHKSN